MDATARIEYPGNLRQARRHSSYADRYGLDAGICSAANGWAHFDTGQDCSYFGTWCNPFTLQVMTYAEGDACFTTAPDAATFVQLIRHMVQWNNEAGHGPVGIDPRGWGNIDERLMALGLDDLIH